MTAGPVWPTCGFAIAALVEGLARCVERVEIVVDRDRHAWAGVETCTVIGHGMEMHVGFGRAAVGRRLGPQFPLAPCDRKELAGAPGLL